ncbi:hydrolase, partial [Maribellus luteus]
PASQVVVYRDAGLIDGLGGGVKPHMAVIVEGAVIKAVLPDQQLSKADLKGAEVVDLSGRYLLPGLVDSHVHLATSPNRKRAEALMRREVYGGVTAVRDMAGDGRALADLARASRVGEIPGPDIFYAALMAGPGFFADQRTVSATQGATAGAVPWMQAVTSQTDLPLAVALARGTSASGIKTYADISGRLLARITAEAHRQGMRVWSHGILFPATPEEVVAAGVDVISHACQAGFQAAAPPPVS